MRRFWLLLLAFVLPLQMSWAAVHFCDDQRPGMTAGAHVHAELGQHVASSADEGSIQTVGVQEAEPRADCCGAAHGCHGLHHLMAQPELSLRAGRCESVIAAQHTRFLLDIHISRVERPKWPAA